MPLKHLHLAVASPVLLLGTGLCAAPDVPPVITVKPLTPAQSQALRQLTPLTAPQAQRGPGDIIPPCVLVFGWTTQGPTDRAGNLISLPPAVRLPRTYLIGQAAVQRR